MTSVYEILTALGNTTSRKLKEEILRDNKDNPVLKEVVRLALDPFINFYQRVIPEYPLELATMSLAEALQRMETLSSREKTGNEAKAYLADLLSHLNSDDDYVVERVVLKDLKCGVQEATANAVWKNLIPKYPVMLCNEMDRDLIGSMKFPVIVQTKMDGLRVNAHVTPSGTITLRSRNGKELYLKGRFNGVFAPSESHYVVDGELLVVNQEQLDYEPRKVGNGILNKAIRGTISEEEASRVVMVAWDMIPIGEFRGISSTHTPYEDRFQNLRNLLVSNFTDKVRLVDTFTAGSLPEVEELFSSMLEHGEEGVIVKDPHGIWAGKRSKQQIKMKAELECDLRVVAAAEGAGKYVGKLGALVCESEDGKIHVEVGTGFDDIQRESFKGDALVNRIVSVKYNTRISNKDRVGVDSLFLPVFIELREDKTKANTSNEVKA